jgi:hypothetical protein
MEVELASSLQSSALFHVAESTSGAYVYPSALWPESLKIPRRPLLADGLKVALYL